MKNIIVKALIVISHTLIYSALIGIIFYFGYYFFSDTSNHIAREKFTTYWIWGSLIIFIGVTIATYLAKKDYKSPFE